MKSKNIVTSVLLSVIAFVLVSCKPEKEDWNSPKKIYNMMCSCKNKNGLTIDGQLLQFMIKNGQDTSSTDKVNTYISSNTSAFMGMIDAEFKNDTIYLQNLVTVKDTLNAHGSDMNVQGGMGDLFSIKSKYPGCIAALPYITQ